MFEYTYQKKLGKLTLLCDFGAVFSATVRSHAQSPRVKEVVHEFSAFQFIIVQLLATEFFTVLSATHSFYHSIWVQFVEYALVKPINWCSISHPLKIAVDDCDSIL